MPSALTVPLTLPSAARRSISRVIAWFSWRSFQGSPRWLYAMVMALLGVRSITAVNQDADRALIKALFSQAVDAVGTQEAAAAFLGISRQRIGQLISTANADVPTVVQILKLQRVTRSSLVFGPLARLDTDEESGSGALTTAVESTAAASRALQAVHAAKADGVLEKREIDDVRVAARQNLEAAQRQYDESMRLRPTMGEAE